MSFKFQSDEGGRSRAVWVLVAVIAACYSGSPQQPTADIELVIEPEFLQLEPQQQVSFTVTAYAPDGEPAMTDLRNRLGHVYAGAAGGLAYNWSSTGGIVDETGRFAASAQPGEYYVIVSVLDGRAADTALVMVSGSAASQPTLSQVVLSPPSAQLNPGASQPFTVFGRMSDGDSVDVQVSFQVTGGTMTPAGLYTAGDLAGSFEVIATDDQTGLADTSIVSISEVIPTLVDIALVPATAALLTGGTQQFNTNGVLSNGDTVPVSAAYSATGGTISTDGFYQAGATPGDYVVVAVADNGSLADTSTVTVSLTPVAQVLVTPSTATIAVDENLQLVAATLDANGLPLTGRQITWESVEPSVATVSAAGAVRGVAPGTATIRAESEGKTGTAQLTVTQPVTVTTVSVTPLTADLTVGGSVQLTATAKDAEGTALPGYSAAWSTDNAGVATVTAGGRVDAVGEGTAAITAAIDGVEGTATVSVSSAAVASVQVSPATMNLVVGNSAQLSATPQDASGNALQGHTVAWSSNNAGVATVTSSGRVDAVGEGTATISAAAGGAQGTATVSVSPVPPQSGQVRAFPGAEGFGAFTTGGRGGIVYHVTNTNTSGDGSLWKGLAMSGPRTIVFDVSGTFQIPANSYGDYFLHNGNLTIAGQTAPGDGVTLRGGVMHLWGADNIIIRHIRFRPGGGGDGNVQGVSITGKNVIIDHASLSWNTDDLVAIWKGADNVTVQWSLLAETIQGGEAILIAPNTPGEANISIHHNVIMSYTNRWSQVSSNSDGNNTGTTVADLRNNVVYNWHLNGTLFGGHDSPRRFFRINQVHNWYKSGPSVWDSRWINQIWASPAVQSAHGANGIHVYEFGNEVNGVVPHHPNDTYWQVNTPVTWLSAPHPIEQKYRVTTQPTADARARVLAEAGATVPKRDAVDVRVLNELREGRGQIPTGPAQIQYPTLVSAPAPVDTDRDGMPDQWETQRGLNPNNPNDRNGDRNGDGYTNLEEYLDWLVRQ